MTFPDVLDLNGLIDDNKMPPTPDPHTAGRNPLFPPIIPQMCVSNSCLVQVDANITPKNLSVVKALTCLSLSK